MRHFKEFSSNSVKYYKNKSLQGWKWFQLYFAQLKKNKEKPQMSRSTSASGILHLHAEMHAGTAMEYLASSHRRLKIKAPMNSSPCVDWFPERMALYWGLVWIMLLFFWPSGGRGNWQSFRKHQHWCFFGGGLILKLLCLGVFKSWTGKCRPLVIVLMRSAYLRFLLGRPICGNDMGN